MITINRNQAYNIGLSFLSQGYFPSPDEYQTLFQGQMPETLDHIFNGQFNWKEANDFFSHLQTTRSFANAGLVPLILEHLIEKYHTSLTLESLNMLNRTYRNYILNYRFDIWIPLLEQNNNHTYYEHFRLYEDVTFEAATLQKLESDYPHIFYDFYRVHGLSEQTISSWSQHAYLSKLLPRLPASFLANIHWDELALIPPRNEKDVLFLQIMTRFLPIKRVHDCPRFLHLMRPKHESPLSWAQHTVTHNTEEPLFDFLSRYWSNQPDSESKNMFMALTGLSELYDLNVIEEYEKMQPIIHEQAMLYLN